jgi:hypothetical protein
VTASDGPGVIDVAGASLDHFCRPAQSGGNDGAFCADANALHTITQANLDAGLVSRLAEQAQADHQWTAKMATDAPDTIATAMKASAAAYAAADAAEAAVGYEVVGGPDVINAIQTATQAVASVQTQNQQIEQYINTHCGFTFQFA